MTDLYELTRKLVARGCPEPERLRYNDGPYGERGWFLVNTTHHCNTAPHHEDDARAIWTMWAREWAADRGIFFMQTSNGWFEVERIEGSEFDRLGVPDFSRRGEDTEIEAIEAATRHTEPTET